MSGYASSFKLRCVVALSQVKRIYKVDVQLVGDAVWKSLLQYFYYVVSLALFGDALAAPNLPLFGRIGKMRHDDAGQLPEHLGAKELFVKGDHL